MRYPSSIFLASGNRHKIEELQAMLKPLGVKLVSTLNLAEADEVEEDRPTLEGNARKKAQFWHAKTGLPALADDTGLEVDALGGAPGVYSARYAGEGATDEQNIRKLLKSLHGKENRSARFRTVIALAGPEGEEQIFEGVCEGEILHSERGAGGFGYDPVFLPEGFEQAFAELSPEEKNRISHRGRALKQVIRYLKALK